MLAKIVALLLAFAGNAFCSTITNCLAEHADQHFIVQKRYSQLLQLYPTVLSHITPAELLKRFYFFRAICSDRFPLTCDAQEKPLQKLANGASPTHRVNDLATFAARIDGLLQTKLVMLPHFSRPYQRLHKNEFSDKIVTGFEAGPDSCEAYWAQLQKELAVGAASEKSRAYAWLAAVEAGIISGLHQAGSYTGLSGAPCTVKLHAPADYDWDSCEDEDLFFMGIKKGNGSVQEGHLQYVPAVRTDEEMQNLLQRKADKRIAWATVLLHRLQTSKPSSKQVSVSIAHVPTEVCCTILSFLFSKRDHLRMHAGKLGINDIIVKPYENQFDNLYVNIVPPAVKQLKTAEDLENACAQVPLDAYPLFNGGRPANKDLILAFAKDS
jgi:hypothetical protein